MTTGQFKKRHEGVRLRLATMKDTLFYFCPIYKLRENPKIRIRKIQKELDRLNNVLGNTLNLEQLELEGLWQLTVSGPWPGPLLLTCPMQAFGIILLSNVPGVSAHGLSPSPPQAGQSTWGGSLPNAALANDKCSHLRLEKKLKNKVRTTTFLSAYRTTLKHLHYIPDNNLWVWLLTFRVLAVFSSLSHFLTSWPVFPGTTSQIKDFTWILVCWRIPK